MFCKIILATALLVVAVASPVENSLPEDSEYVTPEEQLVETTETMSPNKCYTEKDLKDIFKQTFPGDPSEMASQVWRRLFDKNNVGCIDEEKFLQAKRTFYHGTTESLFSMLDENGDEHLTRNELLKIAVALEKAELSPPNYHDGPRRTLRLFEQIDKNNNNYISLQEYRDK